MKIDRRLQLPTVAALLLCACGNGSMPAELAPALATIHGTLQIASAPPRAEEIRVALVWDVNLADQPARHVFAQDVAVSRTWPAEFTLAITDLPPENALRWNVTHYYQYANAGVVAYRDVNHNQKLDFTPLDADGFTDELIAYNGNVQLGYVTEGNRFILNVDYEDVDLSTPITLNAAAPGESCFLLETPARSSYSVFPFTPSGPWSNEHAIECPDLAAPAEAETVMCEEWNYRPNPSRDMWASWSAATSTFVANTCGPVEHACWKSRVFEEPVPASWPCPCDPTKYECLKDLPWVGY